MRDNYFNSINAIIDCTFIICTLFIVDGASFQLCKLSDFVTLNKTMAFYLVGGGSDVTISELLIISILVNEYAIIDLLCWARDELPNDSLYCHVIAMMSVFLLSVQIKVQCYLCKLAHDSK